MIKNIQRKVGVSADGQFGGISARAVRDYFKMNNFEAAHFLGETFMESGGFKVGEENLMYSALRLVEVFPKYFNTVTAQRYGYNPVAIANRVYANRMGNGDEQSGDGWRHRGFGPLQLTGKSNQHKFADYIQDQEVKSNPSLIATKYELESAVWYFKENCIFKYCKDVSRASILNVARIINVGTVNSRIIPHGLDKRVLYTERFYSWLILK